MTPADLKSSFLKAGLLAVLVSACAARVSPLWASHYAAIAVWGLLNWGALAMLLTALVARRTPRVIAWACAKIALLILLVGFWIPTAGLEVTSFAAGLNTLFVVIVLQAIGGLLTERRPNPLGDRRAPVAA